MGAGPDQRDSRTWVIIELTRAGEAKVEDGSLADAIRKALAVDETHSVFVPSLTYMAGNRRTTVHLMEGYAFVESGLPEVRYYRLEHSCPYVKKVLTSKGPSGMRVLSVIPEEGVQDMRRQLAQQVSCDVVAGTQVTVTEGVYNNLDGEVIGVAGEDAHVRFQLRSIDIITTIPRVFLTPSSD